MEIFIPSARFCFQVSGGNERFTISLLSNAFSYTCLDNGIFLGDGNSSKTVTCLADQTWEWFNLTCLTGTT